MVATKRILVTGATGTVGKFLVRRLAEQGADVTAAVTHPAKARQFEQQRINTVLMDFADPDCLLKAIRGADRVFLLLPFGEPMSRWGGNAIAAARRAGIEHIVRLSGFGADPSSWCLLNRIQGHLDALVTESGLPWTLLRPNAFMQNFAIHNRDMIRRDSALYLPHGDARVSYIDARDIAEIAAGVLLQSEDHHEAVLEITGPEALAGAEVAANLSAATGRSITYHPVDESAARKGMQGMSAWNVEVLLSMSAFVRAGEAAPVRETTETVTGRRPIPFKQFASDYVGAWK